MKLVLSWMREFAPIEGEAGFLADTMTSLGMAVESFEAVGADWNGIIVARVLGLLRAEFDRAMALCGCPDVASVTRDLVEP